MNRGFVVCSLWIVLAGWSLGSFSELQGQEKRGFSY